jgi:2,3-dihydroxy-p-cumate/2,3-dihydroxybenzoate 3,4-dioxygenase
MIRYRKLGYAELNVTDLERARAFYTNQLGLQFVGEAEDGGLLFRCTDEHHAVVLHKASVPGIRCSGWMLEDAPQFDKLYRSFQKNDVRWEVLSAAECRSRGLQRACRIQEPNIETTLEFYIGARGGEGHAFTPTLAKIQRLGHVVYGTPKKPEAVAFFRDVLNFRVSDFVEERATFMRCFPNPYHHGVGIAASDHNQFHHLNFMVSEIDDIGRGQTRFRSRDIPIVYGPGRHPISESIFLYFLDPDGLTLEYSFGMEEFPEHDAREPRSIPGGPETSDAWGSRPDPRFGRLGAVSADVAASHRATVKSDH